MQPIHGVVLGEGGEVNLPELLGAPPADGVVKVTVAGFCEQPPGGVRIFLDGVERKITATAGRGLVEALGGEFIGFGSEAGIVNLAPGLHQARAVVEANGTTFSTSWSFRVDP